MLHITLVCHATCHFQIALLKYKTGWYVNMKALRFSTRDSTRFRDGASSSFAVVQLQWRILEMCTVFPMWLRRVSTHPPTHPPTTTHTPLTTTTTSTFSFFSLLNWGTGSGSEWGTDGPSDARPRGEEAAADIRLLPASKRALSCRLFFFLPRWPFYVKASFFFFFFSKKEPGLVS